MAQDKGTPSGHAEEIAALKRQMEEMARRIEELSSASAPVDEKVRDAAAPQDEADSASEAAGRAEAPDSGQADAGVSSEAVEDSAAQDAEERGSKKRDAEERDASPAATDAPGVPIASEASEKAAAPESPEEPVKDVAVEPVPTVADDAAAPACEKTSSQPAESQPAEGARRADDAAYAVEGAQSEPAAANAVFAAPASDSAAYAVPADAAYGSQAQGGAQKAGAPIPPPDYSAQTEYAQQQASSVRNPYEGQAYSSNPYEGAYAGQQVPYGQSSAQQTYQQPYGYGYGYGYGGASQGAQGYQAPVVRTKDHVAAGLLGVFLGAFGIHKFYLGYNTAGFIMLGVAIIGGLFTIGLATSVVWLIGLIEGVIYLIKNQAEFEQAYIFNKREWF